MTNLVHAHLSEIQRKLNAPKSRRNNFGNYDYRNCEDILEGIKKILPDGCHVTLSDSIEMVGDRIYVKAVASFSCDGNTISVQAYAREPLEKKGMDSAQITGATSSYARKYALNGLFSIDDNRDPDEQEQETKSKERQHAGKKFQGSSQQSNLGKSHASSSHHTQTTKPGSNVALISIDQEMQIGDLIRESGADRKAFFEHYGISNLSQLTQEKYDKALRKLTKKMADNAMDGKSKYIGV